MPQNSVSDAQKNHKEGTVQNFVLIDSNGNIVVEYVYDAWGNHAVLSANGADLTDATHIGNRNPFRYRGYFYDVETGLYYLQTRYYDPEIGRFVTIDDLSYADPRIIHGLNLYAYCGNNPVNYIDPTGEFLLAGLLIGLIGGAIIGGVVSGVTAYNSGARGWELFGQIAAGAVIGGAVGAAFGAAAGAMIGAGGTIMGMGAKLLGMGLSGGGLALANGMVIGAGTVALAGAAGVVVGGAIAIEGVKIAISGLNVLFSRIGKSRGYIIDHHYPNDHDPPHVHISGDDGKTRVDINGNPIQGDRPMTPGEKKAFKKLWQKIYEALMPWLKGKG